MEVILALLRDAYFTSVIEIKKKSWISACIECNLLIDRFSRHTLVRHRSISQNLVGSLDRYGTT